MCLAIPGQIVEWVDEDLHIAKAQVANVRRNIVTACKVSASCKSSSRRVPD